MHTKHIISYNFLRPSGQLFFNGIFVLKLTTVINYTTYNDCNIQQKYAAYVGFSFCVCLLVCLYYTENCAL